MAHYFVSDVHAGLELAGQSGGSSAERFTAWLDAVAADADAIYLLGDIFDFWFEYRTFVPLGYELLLDKFRELTDRGVELHFFHGNHDRWTLDHLVRACSLILHPRGFATEIHGQKVYMEHGDRQSIRGWGKRSIQWIFRSRLAQALARRLIVPQRMQALGTDWSRSNRAKHTHLYRFEGAGEGVARFARKRLRRHPVDLFVFGHLHAPTVYRLPEGPMLYILGDWITERSPVYGRLDEKGFSLNEFTG
jgi:UDP-2,3-diacylglucosamine hydrolase